MELPDTAQESVTDLLIAWKNGDQHALDFLIPLIEGELRRIAHNYMRKESGYHSLQTTALINEAYLKLINQRDVYWQNRSHFFAISAQIMRRILLNHARHKTAQKRGDKAVNLPLDYYADILTTEMSLELIALDEALNELAEFDLLKSRIVELRYFRGLTIEETAEVLGIAPITVSTHWRLARAWLARKIGSD